MVTLVEQSVFFNVFFVASRREAIAKARLSSVFDSKSTHPIFVFQNQKVLTNPGGGFVSCVSRVSFI